MVTIKYKHSGRMRLEVIRLEEFIEQRFHRSEGDARDTVRYGAEHWHGLF